MAKTTDWFPGRRDDVLVMAWKWVSTIQGKITDWGIPEAKSQALRKLTEDAADKLSMAKSTERTVVSTAECKIAFDALEAAMRDMKKRYFLKPPLTDADLADLGLPFGDDINSPVPIPVDHPGLEITKWALHQLKFKHFIVTDNGGARSNHGIRVYYALVKDNALAPTKSTSATRLVGELFLLSAPPESQKDLTNSFFTRRKVDSIEFPPEASGYICYLAARLENSKGKPGPWSAMINTVIP